MPRWTVQDDTGSTLVLEGESAPSETELEEIFKSRAPQPQPAPPPAAAPLESPSFSSSLSPSLVGGQPQFMSERPATPSTPRAMALASRERRGPELLELPSDYVSTPVPEPSQPQPSLIGELSTAPVGLGTFGRVDGKATAPGSQLATAQAQAETGGRAPIGLPTPASQFISALPEGKIKDLSAGAYNAAANAFNFFLSPLGWAALGVGNLPPLPQRAIAAKFAYDMAKAAPEQLGAGDEAYQRGDMQGAAAHWLGGAVSIAGAGMAGAHAARPIKLPAMERRAPPVINETIVSESAAAAPRRGELPEVIAEEAAKPVEAVEQTPVRRGAVEDYTGEPGEVVVTAEELKAPAKAEITPAQEQAIAARGGMESLPYEASDLTRYNELKSEQGKLQSEGKIISPETGEFTAEWSGNWKEFEALRNKYNGMPPKQVATASPKENASKAEAVAGTGEQPMPAPAKPAAEMTPEEWNLSRKSDTLTQAENQAAEAKAKFLEAHAKWMAMPAGATPKEQLQKRNAQQEATKSKLESDHLAQIVTEKTAMRAAESVVEERRHRSKISDAMDENKPISAIAMEAYGMKPRDGYVREGNQYIYKPKSAVTPAPENKGGGQGDAAAPVFRWLRTVGNPKRGKLYRASPDNQSWAQVGNEMDANQAVSIVKEAGGVGIDNAVVGVVEPTPPQPTAQPPASAGEVTGSVGARIRTESQKPAVEIPNPPIEGREIKETLWTVARTKDGAGSGTVSVSRAAAEKDAAIANAQHNKSLAAKGRAAETAYGVKPIYTYAENPKTPGQGPGAKTGTTAKPETPESYEGTGLKHAIDELERVSYGFKERTPQEKQNMAQAWIRAGETIAARPHVAQELAQALIDNPKRGLTGDESALILRAKVHLQNAINDAAEKTFSSDPAIKTEGEMALARLMGEMNQLLDAVAERGSEWGREGRWRQALAYEDFTFATQERLLRASKGGEPLTSTERNKLLAEIETHKARVAQLEKDLAAAKVKDAQANVTDTVTTVRAQSKKDKAAGKVRDLAAEQKAVVDHLKEQFLENDADLSGEGMSIRKLMELLVEREGITERLKMEDRIHEILQAEVDTTITREQAMDLMSGYGKSRLPNPTFAKRTVRDINAQILSVRKLLDYFKGQRPKLTGQLRDAPSQIQRNWIKMVNEAKKAFHLEDTGDNAKMVKSAIDAINTRLTNRIKDLKSEIVTRHKIIRERSPSPYNAETLELRRELEEVQKAHKEIFGEPTLSDAQRLDRAEKAAERQIVELQRQLDSGEIFSKRQQAFGLSSSKLEAAKARLEELKQQRQYARQSIQPKPEPHEQFALNYLLRLRQRAAEYNERAARGDFAKPVKPPREHGPDVLKAMAEVEQSKQNFYQARYEAAQRLRSVPRKIWDGIRATKDAFVNIKSSFDFSAPRQMFLAILGNSTEMLTSPIAGAKIMFKPLGKMFEAWASESRSAQIEQWRKSRPNAMSGADKTAGIQYTELHTTDFTKAEENARSVLDEWAKLPLKTGNLVKTAVTALPKLGARGVRMSNRAFITALNVQRAALFDYLLSVNYKDRAPTDAELRVVGNLVNVSTGRGKLSRGVAKVTGEVLWSPSLLASRLQVLTGQPLWTGLLSGDAKGSFRARKIVAKQYARWLISGAALYGISRLFTDDEEAEPTSSDLGKVVRGDTRIDPWAGFQQPIVAASRIVTGESTSIEGKARDINAGEVIWNFFKNKTRPDVVAIVKGVIAAIDSGKDERDVRVTPKEAAMEMLPVPLALQDVIKVMRENGMTEGAIIQVLSEFGVGVNVYEEYERQR